MIVSKTLLTLLLDKTADSHANLFTGNKINQGTCLPKPCQVDNTKDTSKLQKDIDQVGEWARKWGMRFQPVKWNILQLIRKQIKDQCSLL